MSNFRHRRVALSRDKRAVDENIKAMVMDTRQISLDAKRTERSNPY